VQITVKTLKDRAFLVDAEPTTTVRDIKGRIAEQDAAWEAARQRIIFKGRELPDGDLVAQCGLDDGAPTCHVVMRLPASDPARRKSAPAVAEPAAPAPTRAEPPLDGELACGLGDDELMHMPAAEPLPMEFETAWKEFEESAVSGAAAGWDTTLDLPALPTPTAMLPLAAPAGAAAELEVGPAAAPAPAEASYSDTAMVPVKAEDAGAEAPALPVPSTQGRAYDLSKVDDKLRKRLLKNRLSAERSRQRKQAHVETLEFELSCCRSENEHLRQRVAALEERLAALSVGGAFRAAAPSAIECN